MNTNALRAYHGKQEVKDFYIDRVRRHRLADELTQGIGWENGKGCAVGCCLENYDHSRYPIELGMQEWLARLEDSIFEGLPKAEAMVWPESFLEAIIPGVDLEPVRNKLALLRIDRLIALQNGNLGKHGAAIDAVIAQTILALGAVRSCHEAEIGGGVCDLPSARSAAWSAAEAARSALAAAEAAAWSALAAAEAAAWSAESAAWSARSAAWSAEAAARSAESAAWSAYRQEASDLLRLLREATP